MVEEARKRLLIVAGRDASGAGVAADLAAVSALAVDAIAIVTAETDQDAKEVRSIGARDPREWGSEAREAVRYGVAAVKFGLLPGVLHVREASALAREIQRRARQGQRRGSEGQRRGSEARQRGSEEERRVSGGSRRGSEGERRTSEGPQRARPEVAIVVDPVIRASSGGLFLDAAAVELLRGELVAAGVVLTPNLSEAAELACVPVRELESSCAARLEAARMLLALGAAGVVIKGGHGSENPVRDLVAKADGSYRWLEHPRSKGPGIRGSGCRFASRLAAALALGRTLEEAAEEAGGFVAGEIERAAGGGARG